jgi:hypothetical protein
MAGCPDEPQPGRGPCHPGDLPVRRGRLSLFGAGSELILARLWPAGARRDRRQPHARRAMPVRPWAQRASGPPTAARLDEVKKL